MRHLAWLCVLLVPVGHAEETAPTCTISGNIQTKGKARGPVVVFVHGPGPVLEPGEPSVVSQKNKSFDKDAVIVAPGTEVVFPNKDAVHHHLYSHAPQDPFELDQHAPGSRPSRIFDASGSVRVQCNIHENMETHVLVLPNAWATEADEQGRFEITDVAIGTRTVEAWSAWHRSETLEFECTSEQVQRFEATLRRRSPGSGGPESDGAY